MTARRGGHGRLGLAVVVLAVGVACAGPAPPAGDRGPLAVVATTTIVADLVRQVGGDEVAVEALMGSGVDPHLYKASAGDVRRMSSAEVIVYTGLHLEGKMAELFEQMAGRGVATHAVTSCVAEEELLAASGFSGVHDPHVWFDVRLWMSAAECVRDELVARRPAAAATIQARAEAYLTELEALDAWVRERLATVPEERRVLVTAHDAFAYFGRAYGFTVKGLLGVSTASEAGTSDVQELAAFIAERGIPAVFVETSVSPRFVQALQEAVEGRGGSVTIGGSLYSDALGDPGSEAETYVGTVRANVDTIVRALVTEGTP